MRKYYQLLLFIVACLSVVSFLFYKHEYDRLRKVLEVLDIFGTKPISNNAAFSQVVSNNTSDDLAFLNEPLPAFQRLSDDFFAYSAYWVPQRNGRSYVKSLAVGYSDTKTKFNCKIQLVNGTFQEGRAYYYPIETKYEEVSHGVLPPPNLTKFKAYIFLCHLEKASEPFSVQFYISSSLPNDHSVIPIHHLGTDAVTKGTVALCILPFTTSSYQVSQFVAFHELVGVEYFLFYDPGFDQETRAAINVARKYGYNTQILPWNFPFATDVPKLLKVLVEQDCLMRTSHLTDNVAILTTEDLIIPQHHHSLGLLFSDFDSSHRVPEFTLHSKLFCSQKPPLNILKMTNYEMTEETVNVYRPLVYLTENTSSGRKILPRYVPIDIASVHIYKYCTSNNNDDTVNTDTIMQKFQDKLLLSEYLKKWFQM